MERAWLANYEALMDEVLQGLSLEKLQLAQDLLELPDSVRGYGPVKERFLGHAEQRQARLLEQWRNGPGPQFHPATPSVDTIALTQL